MAMCPATDWTLNFSRAVISGTSDLCWSLSLFGPSLSLFLCNMYGEREEVEKKEMEKGIWIVQVKGKPHLDGKLICSFSDRYAYTCLFFS